MSERLIKRLTAAANAAKECGEYYRADLLQDAADAPPRPAPAVQVPVGMALVPCDEATAASVWLTTCASNIEAGFSQWECDEMRRIAALLAAAPTPAPVATEAVAQVLRKGIRLEPSELRAMMEWAGIGDDYDEDDAAPLLLWIGEMKDEEGSATYGLNASNEEVPDEGCWLVKELPRPEVNADKPEQAEDALRSLACWLSVGGYNSEEVDAAEFEKRIREGIETIVRVEVERAKKAVAQGGGVDVEKVMAMVDQFGQEKWSQGDNQYRRGCESSATYYSEEAGRIRDRLRALLASTAGTVGDGS